MKKDKQKTEKTVTIIIPTYNSARTLTACLSSIEHQTYPHIETIIVDNYSKDETTYIAKKFKTKILLHRSERSKAKNLGAKEAQSGFLLFLDADMELTSGEIEECVTTCLENGADAAIIPEEPIGESFLAFYRKIGKNSLQQEACFELPRFFKKETFFRLEGFDENLVCGEDFDFYERYRQHGYKTVKINSVIKHCETDLSLNKIVAKAYHYGRTLPLLMRKKPLKILGRYGNFQKNQLRRICLVKIEPTQLLGFFILRLIETTAYTVGLFIGTIFSAHKK